MEARRNFLKTASLAMGAALVGGSVSAETGTAQAELMVKPLKILAINTSHRPGKTTAAGLKTVMDSITGTDENISCELIELANLEIGHIRVGEDTPSDDFGKIVEIVKTPEFAGLVIGSPVYFGAMSGRCKVMLDRFMSLKKELLLRNKVFGALAVGGNRNGGQELTIHGIWNCLSSQQVVIAQDATPTSHWGATLWNQGDDISKDEFGIETAKNLGKRVAELARIIALSDIARWV